MSYVHPFSKRCDKSEIDLFKVPPTQQSLERGRWIDYAPLSSVENANSAITFLIAGTDEYIDLSKTILTVTGKITKKRWRVKVKRQRSIKCGTGQQLPPQLIQTSRCLSEWKTGHTRYGYICIPFLH